MLRWLLKLIGVKKSFEGITAVIHKMIGKLEQLADENKTISRGHNDEISRLQAKIGDLEAEAAKCLVTVDKLRDLVA